MVGTILDLFLLPVMPEEMPFLLGWCQLQYIQELSKHEFFPLHYTF